MFVIFRIRGGGGKKLLESPAKFKGTYATTRLPLPSNRVTGRACSGQNSSHHTDQISVRGGIHISSMS